MDTGHDSPHLLTSGSQLLVHGDEKVLVGLLIPLVIGASFLRRHDEVSSNVLGQC